MKTLGRFLAMFVLVFAAGCASPSYPERSIAQGGVGGGVSFPDAPADAVVLVNGQRFGSASQFDGVEGFLSLSRGTHLIEVRTATGETLLRRQIYVGNGVARVEIQ